jgi:hypothetical protein
MRRREACALKMVDGTFALLTARLAEDRSFSMLLDGE